MAISEQQIVNALAVQAEAISEIKHAYAFAQNPDALSEAQLPAMIFWPPGFTSELVAHNNRWKNELTIRGSLFVAPFSSRASAKYLDNRAMPLGQIVRVKFQTKGNLATLLSTGAGNVTAWLESGEYGVGGQLLTYGKIEYIGWVFTWRWKEIN